MFKCQKMQTNIFLKKSFKSLLAWHKVRKTTTKEFGV